MPRILLPQRGIMQDRMFDEWAGPLIARGDAKPLLAKLPTLVTSKRAMDGVAASATAMEVIAASATLMDTVVASATAMDAVAASAVAMDAIFASLTGRTLIFTTAYPDKLWGSSTAITSFATYLNGLTRSAGTGSYAVKITMPIDGSLVSAVSSIYSRSTSVSAAYDRRIMKASPSGNTIMDATDVTAWTEYSGNIASDDTGIVFDIEVNYSCDVLSYRTLVVVRANEATYNNVISMSYDGTAGPHYFYKMRFTRRT